MISLFYLLLFGFLLLSLLLSSFILLQESQSMGLGASFGGDAGSSLFGTSTADVLKKVTRYLATIFMILTLLLSLFSSSMGRSLNDDEAPTIENYEG